MGVQQVLQRLVHALKPDGPSQVRGEQRPGVHPQEVVEVAGLRGQVRVDRLECLLHASLPASKGFQAPLPLGEFGDHPFHPHPAAGDHLGADRLQCQRQPSAQPHQLGHVPFGAPVLAEPATNQLAGRTGTERADGHRPGALQHQGVQAGTSRGHDQSRRRRQGARLGRVFDAVQEDQQPPARGHRPVEVGALAHRGGDGVLAHAQGADEPAQHLAEIHSTAVAHRTEVSVQLPVREMLALVACPPGDQFRLPDAAQSRARDDHRSVAAGLQRLVERRDLRFPVDEHGSG
jgi:hypothetical protein